MTLEAHFFCVLRLWKEGARTFPNRRCLLSCAVLPVNSFETARLLRENVEGLCCSLCLLLTVHHPAGCFAALLLASFAV